MQLIAYLLATPLLFGSSGVFAQQEVLHGVNVQEQSPNVQD
jgi:hypothetical protein